MIHLPKLTGQTSPTKFADNSIHFAPVLAEVAQLEKGDVFSRMKTSPEDLSEADAVNLWAEVGPNVVAASKHRCWLWRLLTATRNPLVYD